MEPGGRLTKNPFRVPVALQRAEPVGRLPGNPDAVTVVKIEERNAMPKIDKTGVYEDRDGNRFFFEEGHILTDAQERELTLKDAGLPQTDEEKKRAERAAERQREIDRTAGGGVRRERAEPAALENRMEPVPENRGKKGAE